MLCTPVFSDEDADLRQLTWTINRGGYARRSFPFVVHGKKKFLTIPAHRIVLARMVGRDLGPREYTDHANGVKLDCRRANLRMTTPSGNAQNRSAVCASGIKGASYNKQSRKWQASVRHKGRLIYCGLYSSAEAAGKAALDKRRELGFLERSPGS